MEVIRDPVCHHVRTLINKTPDIQELLCILMSISGFFFFVVLLFSNGFMKVGSVAAVLSGTGVEKRQGWTDWAGGPGWRRR